MAKLAPLRVPLPVTRARATGDPIVFWLDEARPHDAALLAKLARRGVHRLRLSVAAGPYANGVAVYGRETPLNREPVNDPGPMQILAR